MSELPLRHELKYHISIGDSLVLSNILGGLMKRDKNADAHGEYHIRSLYFDDIQNTALRDKIAGVSAREKYRIRIYSLSDKVIRLERKLKRGDYVSKTSALISRDLAEQIIQGDSYALERTGHPLLCALYMQMTQHLLRPRVIVDYVREAYVHPAENTRITLDKCLRTGLMSYDMFNKDLPTIPVLDQPSVILEVKYDRRLPSYLPSVLSCIPSQRSAISKYALSRGAEYAL